MEDFWTRAWSEKYDINCTQRGYDNICKAISLPLIQWSLIFFLFFLAVGKMLLYWMFKSLQEDVCFYVPIVLSLKKKKKQQTKENKGEKKDEENKLHIHKWRVLAALCSSVPFTMKLLWIRRIFLCSCLLIATDIFLTVLYCRRAS